MRVHACIISLCVMLTSLGAASIASGQKVSGDSFEARLAAVAAEIRKHPPHIPDQVLEQDAALIRKTLPSITADYWAIGLSEDDASWAALRAWKSARLESPLRLTPDQPMDEDSFISYVTNEVSTKIVKWQIKTAAPETRRLILERDINTINAAQFELTTDFQKRGLEADEARQASLVAWKEVRLNSELGPNQAMNRASFIAYVKNTTGIVLFDSEPDEADVFMGSDRIGITSKEKNRRLQRTFEDGKKITVSFSKNGFAPVTLDCFAKGRDTVDCRATLPPKQ